MIKTATTYYTTMTSPVGPLLLASDGEALTGLYMDEYAHGQGVGEGWVRDDQIAPLPEARQQLSAYFGGTLTQFDLPLAPHGTPFQLRVWRELCMIPYGTTISYGELARRLGNEQASRAVGLANGRNPISIVIPCHRVIGSSGRLTGYGGGLPRKAALLAFESAVLAHGPGHFPPLLEADAGTRYVGSTQLTLDPAPAT
jgi:methylated-DNA-[protein]-cysteine S-methyltransferase